MKERDKREKKGKREIRKYTRFYEK
jgi:hypothetical protein